MLRLQLDGFLTWSGFTTFEGFTVPPPTRSPGARRRVAPMLLDTIRARTCFIAEVSTSDIAVSEPSPSRPTWPAGVTDPEAIATKIEENPMITLRNALHRTVTAVARHRLVGVFAIDGSGGHSYGLRFSLGRLEQRNFGNRSDDLVSI